MASTEASRRGNNSTLPALRGNTVFQRIAADGDLTASATSSSEMSFADSTSATKPLPKKDPKKEKPTGGIKLKKSLAKKTKPKDTESNGTNTAGATRSPSPSSPTIGGSASKAEVGDRSGTAKCKFCAKPVEKAHYDAHVKHCQDQKKADQRKAREAKRAKEAKAKAKEAEEAKENGDGEASTGDRPVINGTDKAEGNGDASSQATKKPPPKKSTSTAVKTEGPKKPKKRKGEEMEGTDKEPKKKKVKKADGTAAAAAGAGTSTSTPNATANEPPKPKLPKPKGPVNVELQCGVALPNGGFCARSLTCKSHSMGAKRSVPGRSAPYDTLLQQYQKKNQAKQQKLALANQAIENSAEDVEGGEGAVVDSEEEREAVMRAVTRGWGGKPLEQYYHIGSRRRYGGVRKREGLLQALTNNGGRLFAGPNGIDGTRVGAGGGAGMSPDLGGPGNDVATRRASLAQALSGKGAGAGGGGPSRKASVGGGGS